MPAHTAGVHDVYSLLPERWRTLLLHLPVEQQRQLCEIRLRVGRPAMVVLQRNEQLFIGPFGLSGDSADGIVFDRRDGERLLQMLSNSSVYALEEQLRQGFLTLPGGHRVGFCGETVMADGRPRTIKHVGAFNIRIARAVPGCSEAVLPSIIGPLGVVRSTLIVSAPGCGKTTLLRDIARSLSYGVRGLRFEGATVGIIDERSEIAACHKGVPQHDVGPRTDVVDKCPKAFGIMQMLRAMSPGVIITDEIGREEDAVALQEALHAGVSVVASAHGTSWDDIVRRPGLQALLNPCAFSRVVLLSGRRGPGTVESVFEPRQWRSGMHKQAAASVNMA